MIYVIAAIMSYLVNNNSIVVKKSTLLGTHSNATLNALTALGSWGGWLCIIPAAFIVGTTDDYTAIYGVLFMVAAYVASYIAPLDNIIDRTYGYIVGYILSALTLPINAALVVYLYVDLH